MAARITTLASAFLTIFIASTLSVSANTDDNIRQYRAAITKIFLWRYRAMPLFRHGQLVPGDVLQVDNETTFLSHNRCYKNMPGHNYHLIQSYTDGLETSASIGLKIGAEFLSEKIAKVEAQAHAKLDDSAVLTVDPISADEVRPDVSALDTFMNVPECAIIGDLLSGNRGKYAVTAVVLHGRVNVRLKATISGDLDLKAQGELIKLIAKSFAIDEAGITLAGSEASFSVSESPGEMTLAMVPARLSFEELARIVYYLDGKKGADLEVAVNGALTATDSDTFQTWIARIRELLGSEEIARGQHWAELFVSGEKMVPWSAFSEFNDTQRAAIANYAAAMELTGRSQE